MLPQASQARKAIWEAINPHSGKRRIDEAFPVELRDVTRENEMMIRLKVGSTWQVVGSDNYDSLVGSPPVGVVLSEWALAKPEAWDYVRPILAENGGWAIFIYTPRGRNHGWDLLRVAKENDWFHQVLTVDDTKAIPVERLEHERKELISQHGQDVGEAIYQQEYYCSFNAARLGAYYGALLDAAVRDKRVGSVPYDPAVSVITAWDLGIRDTTAVWFCQVVGKEVRLIDYYEASGHGLDHYVKVLREKPYAYESHYLPHDVEVRELGSGKSRVEMLASLGLRVEAGKQLPVADGISAVRRLVPQCWFDAQKCARGIEALRNYHAEWDDKLRAFKGNPLHDWSSHGADAFRELAVNLDIRPKQNWAQPPVKWVV